MKKTIFTLFLIATLVIALTACAGGAPTPGDQAGETQPTTTTPAPTTAPAADRITAAEAEDIALNHAGLSRDAVRFDRTELDKDDGRWEYEIEFHADGWEYDYDIHAETGAILRSEKEQEKPTPKPDPKPTEPTTAPTADRITAAEAEDIALNHAGLSRDAVRFDRTELDKDDGRWEYEIEFHADGWEYDYDIHAETGAILRSEKEQEKPTPKPDPKPTEPTTAPTADRITAAEAEDIALNHAGLSRDAVRFDRTELDKDDGRWEYEIEFYADGWEYSYDIHAETGKILSYDKEIWD